MRKSRGREVERLEGGSYWPMTLLLWVMAWWSTDDRKIVVVLGRQAITAVEQLRLENGALRAHLDDGLVQTRQEMETACEGSGDLYPDRMHERAHVTAPRCGLVRARGALAFGRQ